MWENIEWERESECFQERVQSVTLKDPLCVTNNVGLYELRFLLIS